MKKLYHKITNKKLIEKLKNIDVSKKAIIQYQAYVKGNDKDSFSLSSNKLRRNFMVGKRTGNTVEYGNLQINFKEYKGGSSIEIISVYNKKGKPIKMNVDNKLKNKIDRLIELDLF